MRFEKWQALGNDYLIVERDELAVRADAGARAAAVRRRTSACSPTACCCSRRPRDPAHVADLRIFNPDGSEAELSGNGAREAILYLRRRGWTERDSFSIHTAAGTIRPPITGPDTLPRRHGPREPQLARTSPAGRPTARPSCASTRPPATRRRRRVELPARLDRQPAVRDPRRATPPSSRRSTSARSGRRSKPTREFPNRTNVSWYAELGARAARAHPRAHLRARRGGDAVLGHRRDRRRGRLPASPARPSARPDRRRSRRASIVVLDGGELEVEVGEDLRVHLTGWARPVFAGRLSEEFDEELREAG